MAFYNRTLLFVLFLVNLLVAYFVANRINYRNPQRKKPPYKITKICKATSELKYRDYTLKDLIEYDGVKNDTFILLAADQKVYDVSSAKELYGPGGAYSSFAGRDATRYLAKNKIPNLTGLQQFSFHYNLSEEEKRSLKEWTNLYDRKYPRVGTLLKYHYWAGEGQDAEDYGENIGSLVRNDNGTTDHPWK